MINNIIFTGHHHVLLSLALLAGSLVGVSVLGMALGKYYTQTKLSMLLRKRELPQVEYLNEDHQALVSLHTTIDNILDHRIILQKRCKKDQKAAHTLLLEYGRM